MQPVPLSSLGVGKVDQEVLVSNFPSSAESAGASKYSITPSAVIRSTCGSSVSGLVTSMILKSSRSADGLCGAARRPPLSRPERRRRRSHAPRRPPAARTQSVPNAQPMSSTLPPRDVRGDELQGRVHADVHRTSPEDRRRPVPEGRARAPVLVVRRRLPSSARAPASTCRSRTWAQVPCRLSRGLIHRLPRQRSRAARAGAAHGGRTCARRGRARGRRGRARSA